MDAQQRLLMKIVRRFAAEEVDFAFPTRTLVVDIAKAEGLSSLSASPSGASSESSSARRGDVPAEAP